MHLDYDGIRFRYDPYPIGLARPVMPAEAYARYVEAFPPIELFESYAAMGKPGRKFTLSEKENGAKYRDFVQSVPLWRDFHAWIKSDDFVHGALDMLKAHDIDLGFRPVSASKRLRRGLKTMLGRRVPAREVPLEARFEFSALPADGGEVVPHTDAPSKIVTMVVSIAGEGEWDPAHGGGLDVNRPRDSSLAFNQMNRLAGYADMEVLETFDFCPNQAVVFVKTFNSWHSVRPMQGQGSKALRRTLTIVIETLA
jgi:hypothetical protein